MTVEYVSSAGFSTFLDDTDNNWNANIDWADDVSLLICQTSNFSDREHNVPTYNSVEFTHLATSASDLPRHRLYYLESPPTDAAYNMDLTWIASYQYWMVRVYAFSGVKVGGVGSATLVESLDWSGSQASRTGDLVCLFATNRADPNPTLTYTGMTERASIHNDSTGSWELRTGLATKAGEASTSIAVVSGGGSDHTHLAYLNLEQMFGGGKMILAMSTISDKLDKIFNRGNGLFIPKDYGKLVTI